MRAYLQLLRLPNVFTAMADIFLGYLLTQESLAPWPPFVTLLAASTSLYLAGMVFNDYFDREVDARDRPQRPIPSGRIPLATALAWAIALLAAGAGLGWTAAIAWQDPRPGIVATMLVLCIMMYDEALKRTPAGPLLMGGCRALNVLLGMSLSENAWQAAHWVVAGGIGLYIVGVTLFARTEARQSNRFKLAFATLVMLAGLALVASLPHWRSESLTPPVQVSEYWYPAWAVLAGLIAWRCVLAIARPLPQLVQPAVRNCIFALIAIDALACTAVQDAFWGLVILLLLVPTLTLGRWIYST